MTPPKRVFTRFAITALASIMAVACGSDGEAVLVTTTSRVVTTAASTTTAPQVETRTSAPVSSTTIAEPDDATPDEVADFLEANQIFYRVVRQESTRDGSLLFLEIPPGDYTDVDLENLVWSVIEERDGLYELHVVDNREAVAVLVKATEARSSEEAELLDRHYLVSLLEGSILRFQGPFANLDGFIIGS